jgi:hypothetical protein
MIRTIKKLLFSRSRSSLNLFLILPVLILISVGCLCSERNELRSCITSDGANLVWAGSTFQIIRLSDGAVTFSDSARYADVLCAGGNEILTVKEESVRKNNESRTQRTVVWRNAAKTYRLADIESFQKYQGFIQNRYFVSSSRGFVEKTRTVGSGKSSSTVRYKVYDQPQIFTLEDSTNGQLKSHYLHREKFGLPETNLYDDLWFYALSLDENGSLLFAMHNKADRSTSLHKINMFDGNITRLGVSVPLPKEMRFLEQAVSDNAGKFIAFVYEGADGTANQKLVNVLSVETNQTVVSKNIRGVSFSTGTPRLVFEENGGKLAMMVEGFKFDPTRNIHDITVFDLETGREISGIDGRDLFKTPEAVGLIRLIGDDLLLTYSHKKGPISGEESHLCKVNLQNKQIVWDKDLSGK